MIRTLHISNYALIDKLDIEFESGFNIITGETGAGKSIILGALALLLGGRADIKAVLRDEKKSVIEAVFSTTDAPDVDAIISSNDLAGDVVGECLLRRELLPGGRSRAFINDTPVTLPILRSVAEKLVDVHSQNQNQQLVSEDYQRDIIDTLAGNADLIAQYKKVYGTFRAALKEYTDTRDMLRRSKEDADFISFQYEQLASMDLHPGERDALEKERGVLANANEILNNVSQALTPLSTGAVNAVDLVSEASDALEKLSDVLGDGDTDYSVLAERLSGALAELRDVADTLIEEVDNISADPERLEQVEQRLGQLYSLELKHHVDNTDALIELREKLKTQLATLEDGDSILSSLERAAKLAKRDALTLANQISERRQASAAEFSRLLVERAAPLGMPNLQCEVNITRDKLTATGCDKVEFLFAFNKNQQLLPVGTAASGGEVSRLMLSMKSIIAEHTHLPSIIFDEVDTGVSGDIAGRMGALMKTISNYIQVITITHLPGVAAMGNRHFKVFKEDDEKHTTTRIRTLTSSERESEIALMISGSAVDEAALANARALLSKAKN